MPPPGGLILESSWLGNGTDAIGSYASKGWKWKTASPAVCAGGTVLITSVRVPPVVLLQPPSIHQPTASSEFSLYLALVLSFPFSLCRSVFLLPPPSPPSLTHTHTRSRSWQGGLNLNRPTDPPPPPSRFNLHHRHHSATPGRSFYTRTCLRARYRFGCTALWTRWCSGRSSRARFRTSPPTSG